MTCLMAASSWCLMAVVFDGMFDGSELLVRRAQLHRGEVFSLVSSACLPVCMSYSLHLPIHPRVPSPPFPPPCQKSSSSSLHAYVNIQRGPGVICSDPFSCTVVQAVSMGVGGGAEIAREGASRPCSRVTCVYVQRGVCVCVCMCVCVCVCVNMCTRARAGGSQLPAAAAARSLSNALKTRP